MNVIIYNRNVRCPGCSNPTVGKYNVIKGIVKIECRCGYKGEHKSRDLEYKNRNLDLPDFK